MTANSGKPGKWLVPAVLLIAIVAAVALTKVLSNKIAVPPATAPTAAPRTNLTGFINGIITTEDGISLPSPATVFIMTAAPKTGTSTFCPSCYADCGRHVQTDEQGGFKMNGLDPQLTFQILAVLKGYKPKYANKVDPVKGKRVNINLQPISSTDAALDRSLHGRVVDSKGAPIEGAVVEMQGIETKDGGGRWGGLDGIDPLAVTDGNGEFLLTAEKPFDMMMVKVTARTYADKSFDRLASGATPHDLTLTEGSTLTGRVLLDGKPLPGVSVGLSAVDRNVETDLGHFEVGTGADGGFAFVNLPPDGDFYIYGQMNTMKKYGSIPPRQIHTGKDGATTDAGDLMVGPAYRLAGRVVLSDDKPVPRKTRLFLGRDTIGWDSMQVTLDKDGNFDTKGIPPEIISMSVRIKGYHVSARNLSIDSLNPFELVGRVDHDITNLVLLLDKGPDPRPDYGRMDPDYEQTRNRPLSGAEGVPDHSRDWIISGRVLDSGTKQPIQSFRVTPGEAGNIYQTTWNALHAVDGNNGGYQIYISKRAAEPLLKVEADGYLPESATLIPGDATNVDFALKKGTGPAGTVVTADGKPAAGATVILLDNEYNQGSLNADGGLETYWNKSAMHTVGAGGHFDFKPIWGMKALAAASPSGFAIASLESFATNPVITLEPLGKITGTLKRASGPGTNETLDLMFAGVDAVGINLSRQAETDGLGRFSFDHVPAGHLQIMARQPMRRNRRGWMTEPLQEVDLQPGQALAVNITAADRKAEEAGAISYESPQPKLIPGVEVKGVVLLPDGQPAADADVALQVPGKYLGLGKGAFQDNNLREEGLIVSAGADGSFTLPMYEDAQSVVALNEAGYAQVSLERLKALPRITLQKWGRIEGVLRVGHHLGTNEQVMVSSPQPRWSQRTVHKTGSQTNDLKITNSSPVTLQPLFYAFDAFRARTDDQGRFVITFVPPGEQALVRLVPLGERSWNNSPLGNVEVKPGETTVTNVGGTGRTVVGKIKFSDEKAPDFHNGIITLSTPKYMQKIRELKNDEEREAYFQSKEFQEAAKHFVNFSTALQPDGSFRAEDVLPGKYEVNFQQRSFAMQSTTYTMFTSSQELVVPAARDKSDDSSVDWGEINLEKHTMPVPKMASSVK